MGQYILGLSVTIWVKLARFIERGGGAKVLKGSQLKKKKRRDPRGPSPLSAHLGPSLPTSKESKALH